MTVGKTEVTYLLETHNEPKRKVPAMALIVPGVIGYLLSLTGEGDLMITMAVFGATISYALMMLSHIVLRLKEPGLNRPYKTPGGVVTSGLALILATVAFVSTFIVNLEAAFWSAIFYGIMIAYFALYSRRHLVAKAPEEEFEAIAKAEAQLSQATVTANNNVAGTASGSE